MATVVGPVSGQIQFGQADAHGAIYYSLIFFSDKDFELEAQISTNATASSMPWTLQRVLLPGDFSAASTEWRDYRKYAGDRFEGVEMSSEHGAHYRIKVVRADLVNAGLDDSTGVFTLHYKLAR